MSIRIKQRVYETIPTGEYPAMIASIQRTTGQFGDQLEFTFDLPRQNGDEKHSLIGWTSAKFTPKSKLYRWTQAALGGNPIDREYDFNSDDLIGKPVVLVVVVKTGDNGDFNKIEDLLPYRKKAPEPIPQTVDTVENSENW